MSYKRSRATYESDNDAPPPHAPYAVYGTPLPPYDSHERDDGSYVPVWKQEVTDERGRKRLHGAFTGGFSAGYFNTVGSKDGWAPSTFVSSRSNRAKDQKDGKSAQQRPEDFMDDEDLAEQAESQKLETQDAFAGLGSSEGSNLRGGMFSDLFRATGETMGVKLLQKMGWRQGQGVGPKVKRRAQGDAKGEIRLFAPENSRMIRFQKKTDRKGLGFAGEDRLGNDEEQSTSMNEEDDDPQDARILQMNRPKAFNKPKKLSKKSGFGVGVLNETGSEDEDPYAIGPQISYNRIVGGDKKKKKGIPASNTISSSTQKPGTTSRKLGQRMAMSSGFRKCHDGRLPLDGFVLSLEPLKIATENKHPPPVLPEGWTSKVTAAKSGENITAFQSTADAAKASTLDPKSRAALLGEEQLPGKSIFDFVSPAVRDRLAAASGKADLPRGLGEGAPAGFESSAADKRRTLWDLVPPLDTATAAAALQRGSTGWMPYSEDEEKRKRYRYFLELRSGLQSNLPERPTTSSKDEWVQELREFAQAAEVFKPISGLMATRFTSSSSAPKLASDAPDPSPVLPQKEEDPAEKAAKMGMFGPLTRSSQSFFPTRLLCKRFNVRPPASVAVDPGQMPDNVGVPVSENKRLDVVSQSSIDRMMKEANLKPPSLISGGAESAQDGDLKVSQSRVEIDAEKNEALEGQRAGEAVFKAIFGSDDEDD